MAGVDLRPLSLGEILDRTFSLYRRHFLLFIGIVAIPQIPVLALNLEHILNRGGSRGAPNPWLGFGYLLLALAVSLAAYLFSQGGAILAVTELYLGRSTSVIESLRRVWGDIGSLFGVMILNGLAIIGATLLLIIPGIYVACRLLICLPVALIERRGPSDSLSRSFDLSRGSAGRAFLILLLYFVLAVAIAMFVSVPFTVAATLAGKDPVMMRFWLALTQIGQSVGGMLVSPVLLIATAVFYFDLRVRKEAFDLQFMMDPHSEGIAKSSSVLSILP